jgi:hypothetical protein
VWKQCAECEASQEASPSTMKKHIEEMQANMIHVVRRQDKRVVQNAREVLLAYRGRASQKRKKAGDCTRFGLETYIDRRNRYRRLTYSYRRQCSGCGVRMRQKLLLSKVGGRGQNGRGKLAL